MIAGQESPNMKVNQTDSRSISIVADSGVKFSVPYTIFWNGHDRPAESIVLTSPADEEEEGRKAGKGRKPKRTPSGIHEVRAFFLFGEIRDRISDGEAGIRLSRTWSVKTPGSGHLSIDVEFDPQADLACLFPGAHAARGLPPSTLSFLGEKTTYPSSLFLALGRKGVLLFSPSAICGSFAGSIGISRTEVEDEPARLRVQTRFPGIEEPAGRFGPKPGDLQPAEDALIESPGSIEITHEICLTFSSREEIAVRGGAAVIQRLAPGRPAPGQEAAAAAPEQSAPDIEDDTDALADALNGVLGSHLHQAGGIAGLKETTDSPWISISAGLGCALALLKLFPGDARLGELALRFADFALKGQVPWGALHESFHVPTEQWRGVRGEEGGSLLSIGQSARVAELLLALSDELARAGRPHEKYFLAGLRFVDFFLDGKGKLSLSGGLHLPSSSGVSPDAAPGLAGLELFFPVSLVFARTGHDRYRKALDVLVRRFSSLAWDLFQPPASRVTRDSDSAGALLASRLYVEMRALGYKPVEPPVSSAAAARARAADSARLFASLLVPWIRVRSQPPDGDAVPSRSGYLLDSFVRQRLLCAGHETALLLLRLGMLTPAEIEKNLLAALARDCLASARCVPIGTAFIQHTRWDSAGLIGEGRGKRGPSDRRGERRSRQEAGGALEGKGAAGTLGPVDSRRVATEVLAGLRLAEEFPSAS
jgi:hypothetical protein